MRNARSRSDCDPNASSGLILTFASLLGRLVANVRIKGPLARIAFLVELWFDIRSRACRIVGGDCQIRSTNLGRHSKVDRRPPTLDLHVGGENDAFGGLDTCRYF